MPVVRISIHLPYLLRLPPGKYSTPGLGGFVQLAEGAITSADGLIQSRTQVSAVFDSPDADNAELQERQRRTEADRLMRRINRLLRWYRVAAGQPTITELTRAQASPFQFKVEKTGVPWGGDSPLEYEPPNFSDLGIVDSKYKRNKNKVKKRKKKFEFIADSVRKGLNGRCDPDVATLNLLDAEFALSVGRFREAVLLCWGAIDSTFVRKFKHLVDEQLADEWAEGRKFLKGINFGLRHKMTTGWRLLTGQSLYAEPDGFWADLSKSYDKRNEIIHEGQIADEDDARLAIGVARKIIAAIGPLPDM